ncbi:MULTISPECIES: glycosyltransferase family 2 protein [Cellulomonas]|uniref:Glycosyltransferase involved in cell wall biosynthesis n=1 Tax=Cellulomonas iranensis TaxID=76862 RepID=A0ABU0GH29_9CELL|nr:MULTISPECIES: glycosyltransferase family A protein [Cellulomonas]MDQ0424603.1 glycosyltransferase involved in cell wall biosynthesis [Cellulomonas iranensis]TFH70662.1 glycosyltransferase family 2 protein [Cellulomonas sp. HD19AZ1]UCN14091.1 glycosyltransferase family 2 protein [Cellulomonas iranensis]
MTATTTARTIGVVLPTRDRLTTLPAALDSVRHQTLPAARVVVVDDGSTDGTAEYLEACRREDPRLEVLRTGGVGAPRARNLGVAACATDLVAFQDSDDVWSPRFLERLAPHAGPGRVVFASHRLTSLDGSSTVVPAGVVPRPDRSMLRTNVASTQTVLADREAVAAVGFDEDLRRFQDWDLWLTLLAHGTRFVHVPEVLVEVRRQPDSISEGATTVRAHALRRIMRKHGLRVARDPYALARLAARGWLRP